MLAITTTPKTLVLQRDVQTIVAALSLFCAFLASPGIESERVSPPIFFSVALFLAFAALRSTLPVALAATSLAIFAPILFALDKIHGDCYYGSLLFKPNPGYIKTDLEYYLQCTQGAQAFYIMLFLACIWATAALIELHRRWQYRRNRIVLEEAAEDRQSALGL